MIETLTGAAQPRRNFYGRRHGKALRPTQRRHLEELLPRLAVPGVVAGGAVDPAVLLPGAREVWLEIGFGGGEHLAAMAAAHPDIGLVGCEPFVNGVAMALRQIEMSGVAGNVRLHMGDARDLIDILPDGALGRVYLLYPDPWPKARHRDRRFAGPGNLAALARVMAPGAELRLATDIADYVDHSLAAIAEVPAFERRAMPIETPWPGWHRTRYEAKAVQAGRRPNYLVFVRR